MEKLNICWNNVRIKNIVLHIKTETKLDRISYVRNIKLS